MAERYPTSLKLDASLKLRVQRLALKHGRTTHGLLCDAIRAFVEQEEQEERRLATQEEAPPAVDPHAERGADAAGGDAAGDGAGPPAEAGDAGST